MGRIKTGILLLAALLWALPSRAQEPFNPATLLQGRSPSVMVSPVTGCNGEDLSVLVRGGSGIRGDRQPVWIVDGVEINPSVSFLNLYDITDIKVLTNLSDVAPYGDRGANGVVLVTTGARRSEDPLSIRWNSDIGLSFPVLKITGTAPGFNHNHYVSLSGKTIRSEYGVSGWFRQTDGTEPRDNALAGGLRTRFEMRAGKVLSFGMNSTFVMDRANRVACTEPFGSGSLTLLQRQPEFFPDQTVAGWKADYDNQALDKRFTSAIFLAANLGKYVKMRLNLGCDLSNTDRFIWYGDGTPLGHERNGFATVEGNTDFGYNAELLVTWKQYFAGKHGVSVEGAVDAHGASCKRGSMTGDDFFTHTLRARGLNLYNGDPLIKKYTYDSFSYGGFFRAGYDYGGIAGLNALLRLDHRPRYEDQPRLCKSFEAWFDPGKGFFPKGKAVSALRLRASYGEAGREKNMPYISYGDFLMGDYPAVEEGIQMFYEGLWRLRSREVSASLELGFLSDRIRLSAGYFDRLTDDSFLAYCFGQKNGYYWERAPRTGHFDRTATTCTRGFEGELKAILLRNDRLSWDLSAGFACNIAQICLLPEDEIGFSTANVLGYQAASFYGLRTDENGIPVDITGDGAANRYDRQVIGSPMPKYYGTFGTGFRYGDFTLDILASWAAGHQILDLNKVLFEGAPDYYVLDRYLKRGDYLRLSRVSAAYSIPLKKQTVVKAVKLSLTGYDLFTYSASGCWNPTILGVDYGTCPSSAALLLGVSLTFGRK